MIVVVIGVIVVVVVVVNCCCFYHQAKIVNESQLPGCRITRYLSLYLAG